MKRLVPILVVVLVTSTGCSSDTKPVEAGGLSGVVTYQVDSPEHVDGAVSYPQSPPVGGDHAPLWQNCGFYSKPIANENAVHSMEHGAVWIAFDPALETEQVNRLRTLAKEPYTLVSPFPGLESPIVVSAWGKQLKLDSADDPSLSEFLTTFRQGLQTPEPGAVCNGALGQPE